MLSLRFLGLMTLGFENIYIISILVTVYLGILLNRLLVNVCWPKADISANKNKNMANFEAFSVGIS